MTYINLVPTPDAIEMRRRPADTVIVDPRAIRLEDPPAALEKLARERQAVRSRLFVLEL